LRREVKKAKPSISKMETLRTSATINRDGRLKIDIPTPLTEGEVEVVLTIEKREKPVFPYDFSDLAGRLKWNGDALAAQKAIRNEW
jgi:hypothetical protein